MALEIEGTLAQKLPVQSGNSARGPWAKQEFILEFPDGNFTAKACFTAWGQEKVQDLGKYQVGDKVKVSFNLKSREYNGRWYNDLRARRRPARRPGPACSAGPARRAGACLSAGSGSHPRGHARRFRRSGRPSVLDSRPVAAQEPAHCGPAPFFAKNGGKIDGYLKTITYISKLKTLCLDYNQITTIINN